MIPKDLKKIRDMMEKVIGDKLEKEFKSNGLADFNFEGLMRTAEKIATIGGKFDSVKIIAEMALSENKEIRKDSKEMYGKIKDCIGRLRDAMNKKIDDMDEKIDKKITAMDEGIDTKITNLSKTTFTMKGKVWALYALLTIFGGTIGAIIFLTFGG